MYLYYFILGPYALLTHSIIKSNIVTPNWECNNDEYFTLNRNLIAYVFKNKRLLTVFNCLQR